MSDAETAFDALISAAYTPAEARHLHLVACAPDLARVLASGEEGTAFLRVWHMSVLAGDWRLQAAWQRLAITLTTR